MNFETPFFHWFHFAADFIAIGIFVVGLIQWIFTADKQTKVGLQINIFMSYWFRCMLIFISWLIVYGIFSFVFMIAASADDSKERNFIWNSDHPGPYLIGYILSIGLGLFFAWLFASTIWTFSLNPIKQIFNNFLPSNKKFKSIEPSLEILKAEYIGGQKGLIQTDFIKRLIVSNSLKVRATNGLFGDPEWGIPKKLIIDWRYGDKFEKTVVPEEHTVFISKGIATLEKP